jgi:hypothetical protein
MLKLPMITLLLIVCSFRVVSAQVTIQGNIKPHPEWQNRVYLFYFPYYDGLILPKCIRMEVLCLNPTIIKKGFTE